MNVAFRDDRLTVYVGDVRVVLPTLPAESVNCVVTSPPYFGMRDYGMDEQIGLEPTPDEYVAGLVGVFRDLRRVLRADGTAWLVIGDSYAAQRSGTRMPAETLAGGTGGRMPDGSRVNRGRRDGYSPTRNASAIGLKHKDLIGIPWRVAFALQADGWWLRSDIVWSKPNPMPENVRDRPVRSHEYVFLLTKSDRYWYDYVAVREPMVSTPEEYLRAGRSVRANHQFGEVGGRPLGALSFATVPEGRNRRSVWHIATQPYRGAHFATFPEKLVEPCILAGCPPGGVVLDPFGGSGTTALVANRHGRQAILVELNPEYAEQALRRNARQVDKGGIMYAGGSDGR